MHKALHSRDDIDKLYVSKNEGISGFTSIEDWVDATIRELKEYTKKRTK